MSAQRHLKFSIFYLELVLIFTMSCFYVFCHFHTLQQYFVGVGAKKFSLLKQSQKSRLV